MPRGVSHPTGTAGDSSAHVLGSAAHVYVCGTCHALLPLALPGQASCRDCGEWMRTLPSNRTRRCQHCAHKYKEARKAISAPVADPVSTAAAAACLSLAAPSPEAPSVSIHRHTADLVASGWEREDADWHRTLLVAVVCA